MSSPPKFPSKVPAEVMSRSEHERQSYQVQTTAVTYLQAKSKTDPPLTISLGAIGPLQKLKMTLVG